MKQDQLKEINQHISDALAQWKEIMLMADADEWAYLLNYSDEDLLNALYIFKHIAQNIAIKKRFFTEENIMPKAIAFKDALQYCFGFDSIELSKKALNSTKKD